MSPSLDFDLTKFLSPEQCPILLDIAKIALAREWRVYAVGGMIRDCLMQTQTELKDIDLVVDGGENTGIEVAIALHARYPSAKLQIHPKFQTAALAWESFSIDIATARTEIYAYPGANPQVQASSIQQDLYRRDFTVNALAVEINPQSTQASTLIIDLFNGLDDLRSQLIRAIRTGSFAEDPRRMFRAVRFAVRFGFAIAPDTEAEIRATTASGLHDKLGGSRLKAELQYILKSSQAAIMLRSLQSLGVLRCIHPNLCLPDDFGVQLRRSRKWLGWFSQQDTFWQAGLELILSYLSPAEVADTKLNLSNEQITRQEKLLNLLAVLQQLDPPQPPLTKGGELILTPPSPRGEGGWGDEGDFLTGKLRQIPRVLLERARELREAQTPVEQILWECIRDRRLDNFKFRRQHNIGRYIADFYCQKARLVIELDGEIHQEQPERDRARDSWMSENNLTVLRFQNKQVLDDLEATLQSILLALRPSPPAPLPSGEGGKIMRGSRGDLGGFPRPSEIVAALQGYDVISLILLAAKTSLSKRRIIWRYLTHWRLVKPLLSGDDLKQISNSLVLNQGQAIAGKTIGKFLQEIHAVYLNGEISTKAEAIKLMKEWIEDNG
jgi:tRNA nucleotidyltransferase (CCA-adding enzyme)